MNGHFLCHGRKYCFIYETLPILVTEANLQQRSLMEKYARIFGHIISEWHFWSSHQDSRLIFSRTYAPRLFCHQHLAVNLNLSDQNTNVYITIVNSYLTIANSNSSQQTHSLQKYSVHLQNPFSELNYKLSEYFSNSQHLLFQHRCSFCSPAVVIIVQMFSATLLINSRIKTFMKDSEHKSPRPI